MLILKIIFKNKKYYFNIFINKKYFKNNHYYPRKHVFIKKISNFIKNNLKF
jgi:hypothetical protein